MDLFKLPFLTNKRGAETPVMGDERQQVVDLLVAFVESVADDDTFTLQL